MQWFTRASNGLNQFVNPVSLAASGWKFYLVYNVWLIFESTTIWFLYPETKGRTALEEMAIGVKGRDAHAALGGKASIVEGRLGELRQSRNSDSNTSENGMKYTPEGPGRFLIETHRLYRNISACRA
ncbi:hypothetical protein BP5796_03373 [Coleophoma crateriformis]|uniref:Major facilitator superfamily (MFS) profile domain-containing protein n=1 Tax=Coleophoma crateriformis TaxID=565419 RepID=A0A3D8SMW0_9HELO|nr:hypothetical protein BP5796_03373 [Coleophoma crateriformis]